MDAVRRDMRTIQDGSFEAGSVVADLELAGLLSCAASRHCEGGSGRSGHPVTRSGSDEGQ